MLVLWGEKPQIKTSQFSFTIASKSESYDANSIARKKKQPPHITDGTIPCTLKELHC